jgi:hypothetical protein
MMLEIMLIVLIMIVVLFAGFQSGRMYEKMLKKPEVIEKTFDYTTDDGNFFSTTRAIERMSNKKE